MSATTRNTPHTTHKKESLLRGAAGLVMITITLFGFIYSAASTHINQALFPEQAAGSLVKQGEHIVGSRLVAQPFHDARYFVARPSAADYQPMTQTGSNLARTNPVLHQHIAQATQAAATRFGVAPETIPAELVTQSGSGLDPDISIEAAAIQVAAVARARNLDEDAVKTLVAMHTTPSQWGLFGPARINVLSLNLALDAFSQTGADPDNAQAAASMK